MEWMLMPYRRYADFSGRSRRKEYWMFYLLVMIVYVVISVILGMGAAPTVDPVTGEVAGGGAMASIGMILLGVFWLGTIIPALAVSIRRMHDQDRSGWWILVPIANLIFLFIDGTAGSNRFGPDPKGRGA